MARSASACIKVDDYRLLAQRRLPRIAFDFLEGGSEDETGLTHNRAVFERLRFRPRRLTDISTRSLRTELFGRSLPLPLAIAPTGMNGLLWPRGDIVLAQAAAHAGIPFILSTAASETIEEVARHSDGDRWFQLYVFHREIADRLLRRALDAGYSALVLTVDVGVNGFRERDMRNNFKLPFRYTPRIVMDGLRHIGWTADFLRHGMPQPANLGDLAGFGADARVAMLNRQMDTSYDWDDLRRLRDSWPRTLIVKGLLDPGDAARCVALGVDGVVMSNHGGRQLDGALSPLEVLSEAAARIRPAPVMVDSGFRRGSDVVKGLALGGRLVLLGRAVLYGLAARGRAGVDDVLTLLRTEIECVLAQLGCASIADLAPTHVVDRSDHPVVVNTLPMPERTNSGF